MRTPTALAGITLALALTLSACGSDDDTIGASDRDKASAAALEYVGGGAVTDAELGDGDDSYAYQVEVTLPGGTDIDVELDDSFTVTNSPAKAADLAEPAATPSADDDAAASATTPSADDDRPLTGRTLEKASDAALEATGGGRVTETSGSDDADHEYEVDVDLGNDEDVTVELDESFEVTKIDR